MPKEQLMKLSVSNDFIGKQHGWLTPIKPAVSENNLWHCECKCGKTTKATVAYLKGSAIKSCGCLTGKKVDAGEDYGFLKVISEILDILTYQTKFLCACNCGEQILVSKQDLIYQNIRSCDLCKSRLDIPKKHQFRIVKNINDQKYLCLCECGKLRVIPSNDEILSNPRCLFA